MQEVLFKTRPWYNMAQYAGIVSIVILYMIPLKIPLFIYLMFPLIMTVAFFIYRVVFENLARSFAVYRIALALYCFTIPDYALRCLGEKVGKSIPKGVGAMFGIIFLMAAVYVLFSNNKKKIEKLLLLKLFLFKVPVDYDSSRYDTKICIDQETGEDVIIKASDRYLHMLVIGPTGSGKTSQVLIPMIWQDMQNQNSVIVIEPKGDLAEKTYAMGKLYNNPCLYFDPTSPDCPRFSPLYGKEDEVIENLTTTFNMLTPDSKTYFKTLTDNLIRNSVMVLKRIEEAYRDPETGISSRPATLIGLSDIMHNTDNVGRRIMQEFISIPTLTKSEEKQNKDTADWFLTEYYAERSKVYENSSGIRDQISKLIQNKYLRKVLNPENGVSDIDFDAILANGGSIAISTAQGTLRELGSYLGYFLIFNLQSAIFRRPGNEYTRNPCFLYIDEFQKYASLGMEDLLAQGRSYRVSCILATQSREMIASTGRDGAAFLKVVDANARNIVVFPGISPDDAKHFSDAFGEVTKVEERHGESKQKFSIARGFRPMNYDTESTQYSERVVNKYTGSEIAYKKFSEITYRIIDKSSVQMGRDGIVSWIPDNVNRQIDGIVQQYNDARGEKRRKEELDEFNRRRELYKKFQAGIAARGNPGAFTSSPISHDSNFSYGKALGGDDPAPAPPPMHQPNEYKNDELYYDGRAEDGSGENFDDDFYFDGRSGA